MFKLENIQIEEGKKISYQYTVDKQIQEYFDLNNLYYVLYDQDISQTPMSLAVIPLLANIMPISWFVGFDVYIDEIDETFYESLKELKKQFIKFHPDKEIKGTLHVNTIVKNEFKENNTSLLFSGGLDSYDSLTRHYDKNPYYISIHGADVKIDDTVRWNEFKKFNSEEEILDQSRLFYVESNLREFYTYKIDLLVDHLGWWGAVQHGMALLGVLSPLSYKYGIRDINIAASATNEVTYSWGSSPAIDENMKWANTTVTHDGYQFRRTDKTDNVVRFVNNSEHTIKLRVCYADERTGYNCNVCHKCQRTTLSLILSGANPKDYGLDVPDNFYDLIFKNFGEDCVMTKGIKYQWTCIQDKAAEVNDFFVIKDKEKEQQAIQRFIDLDLDEIVNKNEAKVKQDKRRKFVLRQKFPFLYKVYRIIRYQKI
ncbi:hypothetical protein [Aquimarina sp. 2201CG5-10]|uniref:hypothetical protein n=1 Tax=Aquimarina callyspongiae TaxID=3098150 RepID=UPI002AB336C8|nr:hypothetical protein [Aquimarina sp. 2201CG5-10]MDY8136298.1 hypothetical protein [Aquimarina sp. 2201CG5-10]